VTTERDENSPTREPRPSDEGGRKRPYVSPALIEYGTVAKLTQTGGGSIVDGFGMRRMGTCL
jgi:hypothetical protein